MKRLYFVNTLFIYDTEEPSPENAWRPEHVLQRFTRRASAANLATLDEGGWFFPEIGTAESLNTCTRVFVFSLLSTSGSISIGGADPDDVVLWNGRPGWLRVTIGQTRGAEERQLRVVVTVDEAAGEEPTHVRERGEWIHGNFVEVAEPV